jgi:N-acetylglutamate synthase-like GNAT family acetyltransferase
MSKKIYDFTDIVRKAWEHFDKLLDEKIEHIHQLTGIERERLVKLNPAEFIRDKWDNVHIEGYHYQKVGDWVAKTKTPDNYLIAPIDEDVETANQICYKTGQTERKLRAHKCQLLPIPNLVARFFFIKNHRQSLPNLTTNAINYALVYNGEVVAVMSYDLTGGAVRGLSKANKYELLRLAIKHGTQVNGGASKLQAKCEECIRHQGCTEIFSYSNATINEGNVYKALGFEQSAIESGQAWVIERDFSLIRLANCCKAHSNGVGAKNIDLIKRGAIKVLITANRTWIKDISIKEDANV